MIQGDGMVLKGRKPVGLGQMAGVACLRKETEVRQFQPIDGFGQPGDTRGRRLPLQGGMDEHQADEHHAGGQKGEAEARFPGRIPSPARFLR